MRQFVEESQIIPGISTDHSMVTLSMTFNPSQRGPGYWKFNTSLLRDKNYVDKINNLIDIEMNQTHSTKKLEWEMIKLSTRGSTVQYSSRKKKAKKNELDALHKKLLLKQQQLHKGEPLILDSIQAHIHLIQQDINKILTQKAMGVVV